MDLRDRFGRLHDYLRISLTERCNLRCFYCMPEDGILKRPRSEFMRIEEILDIASTFVKMGVRKIRLTGGEPLVRKDAGKILHGLGQLGVELAITTNGILVDQYLEDFKSAGLRSVNLSLDSLNPQKQAAISRRDYFDRIMKNIDLLNTPDFDLKINAVIMKGTNDDEVVSFVEWACEKDLHVRFIEFMPFDGNQWNWDKKVSASTMMAAVSDRFGESNIEKQEGRSHDTAINYKIKGQSGSFGMISPITNPFCDSCNRLRLTADGKLKNCLFSTAETDLLAVHRAGGQIEPMILDSIQSKEKARGGRVSFESEGAQYQNRSMISIGG